MRSLWVAIIAAVVGGLGWLLKIAVMAAQGGPDLDSIPETIAFVTGLLGVAVAAGATGAYLTRHRSLAVRVLAAVGGVVVVVLVVGIGQELLTALPGESWVQAEAIFGLIGLAALAAALAAMRQRPSST